MEKKSLTFPFEVVRNGCDNVEGNLVVYEGDIITFRNIKYEVISFLGKGSYGQVFKCRNINYNELIALKISKGELIYTKPSLKEASILYRLNPISENTFVKIKEDFDFKGHHCLVLELLSYNLYEYLKFNNFVGIDHRSLKKIAIQTLKALSVLHSCQIIHSDVKPENILLETADFNVKMIDLGASFYPNEQIRRDFYIQSRYYRAPEVLNKQHVSTSIDIWSLGCVFYELYMGKPLFAGASNNDQLERIYFFFGDNFLKNQPSLERRVSFNENNKVMEYRRKMSFGFKNTNDILNNEIKGPIDYKRKESHGFNKSESPFNNGIKSSVDYKRKMSQNAFDYKRKNSFYKEKFNESESEAHKKNEADENDLNERMDYFVNNIKYDEEKESLLGNYFANGNDQHMQDKTVYEVKDEYMHGDKIIRSNRKVTFEENVKRNYLRKEDCIKLVSLKENSLDTTNFLDLLFKMIEPHALLRPTAKELLSHKYLLDNDCTTGGMVISLEDKVSTEDYRDINPLPSKQDLKTFSSNYSINDNKHLRRWTYFENSKKKEK